MLTVMIFLFFFFVGLLAALWYHERQLLRQLNELSDEHAQLRVLLRAMESRLDGIAAMEKIKGSDNPSASVQPSAGKQDSLLHLSFDKSPELPSQDLDNDPLRM